MTALLSRLHALIFGDRDSTLSIPIMDGSLKPNNLLENAAVLAERPGLEDLALGRDGELYAACGDMILHVAPDGVLREIARFDRDVTALAVLPDGTIAAALGTSVVIGLERGRAKSIENVDGRPLTAVNALHATADGRLLISDASATRPYPQWSHDLLEKGRSGRVLEYAPKTGHSRTLASGLSYCFGVCTDEQSRVLASESWRHQLRAVADKSDAVALAGLPGYPARLTRASDGGFWLAAFACRTQLVEFVLCENDYRKDMMRRVDPRYWVAPALSSGHDFREPLQGGSVKQMGILKPWAPPRSYGLVIRIGADFIPKYSLHSRVGGTNHGIVAAVQRDDDLYVVSKGAGRILRLSVAEVGKGLSA